MCSSFQAPLSTLAVSSRILNSEDADSFSFMQTSRCTGYDEQQESLLDASSSGHADNGLLQHQDPFVDSYSNNLNAFEDVRDVRDNELTQIPQIAQPAANASAHLSNTTSSSSDAVDDTLPPWHFALRNSIQVCLAPEIPDDTTFDVYTWFLDHEEGHMCTQPRISRLGLDSAEWEEELTFPWRYQLRPHERFFINLVHPEPPRADVETHVAHMIITQRPTTLQSILLSLEFLHPSLPTVFVRFAIAAARQLTFAALKVHVPLLSGIDDNRLIWIHPFHRIGPQDHQVFEGLCLRLQILPSIDDDDHALLQSAAVSSFLAISSTKSTFVLRPPQMAPLTCSFTDEFLQAVEAANDAARLNPPPLLDPNSIEAQPEAIRDLWERWLDFSVTSSHEPVRFGRVETWFLHHVSFTRCHTSRIALLHDDLTQWRQQLAAVWHDKLSGTSEIQIAIVHPPSEDSATGILAQLILTQQPIPMSRSVLISVYDSDEEQDRNPHTFAQVTESQLNTDGFLALLHLQSECPPFNWRNHCSFWFGRIPIRPQQLVNIYDGNAFRIVLSRGVRLTLPDLLALDESTLRSTLSSAISGEVFTRPPDPTFVGYGSFQPPNTAIPADSRPTWIQELQYRFDMCHEIIALDEGPILRVNTWYVNEDIAYHCARSHEVCLNQDSFMWKTDVIFPWREQLLRGTPADFWVLDAGPHANFYQSSTTHVILAQGLRTGSQAIMVSVSFPGSVGIQARRFVHVFQRRLPVRDLSRLAIPAEVAHLPFVVQAQGYTYHDGDELMISSGEHLRVVVTTQGADVVNQYPTGHSEALSLLQVTASTVEAKHRHAIDIDNPRSAECSAFTFNADAPAFQPAATILATQSEFIQSLYEYWIASAIAWEDESPSTKAHWLPQCIDWLRLDWYAWDAAVEAICIYYDGSFLPATGKGGAATAAFVQVHGHWQFAGATSASLETPAQGSYTAELIAALLAVKQAYDLVKTTAEPFLCKPEVSFVFDSLSVGRQAEGVWQANRDLLTRHPIRGILRLIEARWDVTCQHHFVASHQGNPGNEIADTIASCAAHGLALQDWTHFLQVFTQKFKVSALEWSWTLFSPHFLSVIDQDAPVFPVKPTTTPDVTQVLPLEGVSDPVSTVGNVRLRLLTCNVLSLLPQHTSSGAVCDVSVGPARLQTLLQQFYAAGITIFALQETRLRTSVRLSAEEYHLLHVPATSRGHFGIMMGFAKTLPFVSQATGLGQDSCLQEPDLSVVASDPRFLIVRIHNQFLRCLVFAVHAPHSGATQDELEEFWQRFDAVVPSHYDHWPRIVLADANCRFGDTPCRHFGEHGAETSTAKSEPFCRFLAAQHLFVPASFSELHEGPTGTWRHTNGSWTRNDVVAVPLEWPFSLCRSWVDTEIDVSLAKDDHRPACVLLEWQAVSHAYQRPRVQRKCPPHLCHDALQLLRSSPQPHWHVDVHTHFSVVQNGVADCTRYPCQSMAKRPHKQTLSLDTWELVCTKRRWRSNLAHFQRLQYKTQLQMFFSLWRHAHLDLLEDGVVSDFDHLLRDLDCKVAYALHQFRSFGLVVSRALRADDAKFYASLAQESSKWLGPADARRFWQVLRRSLPKFRTRRIGFDPLRLEALEGQWMPHFQSLEVGETAVPHDLLSDCHRRQMLTPASQLHFDIQDLPSILVLEDVLRQTRPNKATGLDVLPSVLFHTHAHELADLYFPLLLKMLLWQHEPLACKGGPMAVIQKKGSQMLAGNYRGIMLLPTFPKRVRALLRGQVMQLLHYQRPPGQLGGFAHQQVMYGSQQLQIFGHLMDEGNISSAVLFVDLTTAFHRLVREWVSGIYVESDVAAVLDAMVDEGLPVADMCERLNLPSLLEKLQAPPFLIHMMRDIHTNTWMTVGRGRSLATTRRGTRPGNPLADCIFHVLMAEILRQLQEWIDTQDAFTSILQEFDVPGGTVTWADDLAIPWATRQATALPQAIRKVWLFVKDLFGKFGFLLNMDKGKTSVVLTFRGPGAPLLRKQFQLGDRPGDTIEVDGSTIFLHYVPHYKHSGAWITPTQRQLQKLRAVLLRMLQKVLRMSREEITTTPVHVIFKRAGQPEPRIRLAVDRLLYAQRLWQHGPAELQHMIHREHALCPTSWLSGLIADLKWMRKLEQDLSLSPAIDIMDMTCLFDFWQGGSRDWSRRVKAALKRHLFQEGMMNTMHRLHSKRLENDQSALFPHRLAKFGSANAKERYSTVQEIKALYYDETDWLNQVRQISFEAIPAQDRVPACVDEITNIPTYLVVHLFSGRRRSTDIHACLEEFASEFGFKVQVLSLDTAVFQHYGNLQLGSHPWEQVTALYAAGYVSATICGSPCETFSEARHFQPDSTETIGNRIWPRPLRSSLRFFGLDGLTLRELRQASQGSEFFLQGILAAAWTLRSGGILLSEHPWKPDDATRVSIWTSPWLSLLLQLPQVALHRVCQWRWGADVSKPTGILAINCPRFAASVYARQLPDVCKPTKTAIGKDDLTGQFRTAILKAYPPAFSRALAGAVADRFLYIMRRRQWNSLFSPLVNPATETWLAEALEACKVIRASAPWLPDYQR
eukprot:s750_g32.t1